MNSGNGTEPLSCCGSCKFFKQEGIGPNASYYCNRYPPVAFPIQNQNGQTSSVSVWPPVMAIWKCGEYVRNIIVAHEMPSLSAANRN